MRVPDVKKTAAALFCCAVGILGLYLLIRYLLPILLPFLFGWSLALLVRPLAYTIGQRTRIPNRVLRLALLLLLVLALATGIWLIGARLLREGIALLSRLAESPTFFSDMARGLSHLPERLQGVVSSFPFAEEIMRMWRSAMASLTEEALSRLASAVPTLIYRAMVSLPRAVLFLLSTVVSAVWFCLDLEEIHRAVLSLFPAPMKEWVRRFKDGAFTAAARYVRAYLTLMAITAGELLIGFLILRVEYALLLSVLFAFVDILPVLGVGTMLVPWSVMCLVSGQTYRGAGLLVLYLITLIVRQVAEPRILGAHLGMHPILTMLALYGGFYLFGVWGMLLAPAVASLVYGTVVRVRGGETRPHDGRHRHLFFRLFRRKKKQTGEERAEKEKV